MEEEPTQEIQREEEEAEQQEQENGEEVEEEVEEEHNFEGLGLDTRLVRALTKKGIAKPTPIQLVAIPLILLEYLYIPGSDKVILYPPRLESNGDEAMVNHI